MIMQTMEKLKSENMNIADKIYIFDTTLRDGEQTPGVALTVDEKIQIAQNINICRYKCLFPFNTLSVNAEF